jgi:hypothetical protein
MSYVFGGIMMLIIIGAAVVLYRGGRAAAEAKVATDDVKATEKANEIVAEKRTVTDTTKRMRDGTF